MRGRGAAQNRGEGLAVESGGDLAAGEIDERGKKIGPADHRVAHGAGFQVAGPRDDERDADAGVVEVPLGEGPLRAVVGGVDEERVTGNFFARERADFAEERVGLGDIGEVARALFARGRGVHVGGRDFHLGGIVGAVLAPRHVRMTRADEEAERSRRVARGEEFGDAGRVGETDIGALDVVEAVAGGEGVVRYFADGGDLVAERVEDGWERGDAGVLGLVVGLGAVARGPEAGEQRGAARAAGGCGDERVGELEPLAREPLHVRRADFGRAIGLRVQHAVVVGDEDDDVGERGF